jgi:hypothetical protein
VPGLEPDSAGDDIEIELKGQAKEARWENRYLEKTLQI